VGAVDIGDLAQEGALVEVQDHDAGGAGNVQPPGGRIHQGIVPAALGPDLEGLEELEIHRRWQAGGPARAGLPAKDPKVTRAKDTIALV